LDGRADTLDLVDDAVGFGLCLLARAARLGHEVLDQPLALDGYGVPDRLAFGVRGVPDRHRLRLLPLPADQPSQILPAAALAEVEPAEEGGGTKPGRGRDAQYDEQRRHSPPFRRASRSNRPPSRDPIGIRLNAASARLTRAPASYPTSPKIPASIRFAAGPAAITRAYAPRRYSGIGFRGIGRHHPRARPSAANVTTGTISEPNGSRCANGFSVTLPMSRGTGSPSRSATAACAHSWMTMLHRATAISAIVILHRPSPPSPAASCGSTRTGPAAGRTAAGSPGPGDATTGYAESR